MLLTVDIGNTNIKLALFEDNQRLAFDMLDSKPIDFNSFIRSFLYKSNIRESQLSDSILSSVVPDLTDLVVSALKSITKKEPIIIDDKHHYGIKISPDITDTVGSDLLVMCAYSYQILKRELIVVSLGTATVIAHVSTEGVFESCLIAPGFQSMATAIVSKSAQLPSFTPSKRISGFLATNTLDAMNIGVYDGFVGMIRYLISGIKLQLKRSPMVIGCGGVGKEIAPYIKEFKSYDPDLVTTGLNYIYNRYIQLK